MSVPPALLKLLAKITDGAIWTIGYQFTSNLIDYAKDKIARRNTTE